jgi:octopine/nopaline transport system ATP-binding protein
VLLIQAVNPWGMAWSRRQNEHNVDLNRNWRRSQVDPLHNDAYDEIHAVACPDTDDLPRHGCNAERRAGARGRTRRDVVA